MIFVQLKTILVGKQKLYGCPKKIQFLPGKDRKGTDRKVCCVVTWSEDMGMLQNKNSA
jgi:hypothetical protein